MRALAALAAVAVVMSWAPPSWADKKKRKLGPPKVSGYMQVFYRHTFFTSTDGAVDAPNFRVQRVRVALEGDVKPWLSYDVSIDPRAPEVAGVLRDAYLTFRVIPRHRIRVGQQKTQFGYENSESSTRLFAVNRTEVSDNLARGATLRDLGVGVLGSWPLGGGFRIEDAVTVVNGTRMNAQDDDTRTKNVWGRIGARYKTDAWWARLGVSGARGDFIDEGDDPGDPADDFRVQFKRVGADVQFDSCWMFAVAEYVWGEDAIAGETGDDQGYYVAAAGKTPYRAGPLLRYDVMGDEFQRWTFGGYYGLPDAPLRVLVNYEYRRLKDVVRGDDRLYIWTQVRF